jgi:hypothetical protein
MGKLSAVVLLFTLAAACGGGPKPTLCTADGECPLHQMCVASGACVSGCLSPADCGGGDCDAHGRCQGTAPDGGADLAWSGGDLASSDLASGDLAMSGGDLASSDLAPPADFAIVDAWICTGTCPDAALEPNNTSATATAESDTVTLTSLAICPRNDVDFYKVTASHGGTLDAVIVNGPCGGLLDVDVIAADGTTVVGASTATANGAKAGNMVKRNDVRFIRVQAHTAGDQNFYTLTISID